jgi:hypothetical protein
MPCSHCGKEKIAAKNLCFACYQRLRNTGSLEYKKRGKPPQLCSVDDCDRMIVANGYCDRHYRIFIKYGDSISTFDYGERKKHPLYEAWRDKGRTKLGFVDHWKDFWTFAKEVGDRPSDHHRMKKINKDLPYGPDNFLWVKTYSCSKENLEHARGYVERNIGYSKDSQLKRRYGITLDDYMDMYVSQQGKCKICGIEGSVCSEKTRSSETLVFDHCHTKGHVRHLLCTACNQGLGHFKDNPELLVKAAAYLEATTQPASVASTAG